MNPLRNDQKRESTCLFFDRIFDRLRSYANRWWYLPLLALLAGLDYFIVVVPVDGLLISTCLLQPMRWARSALFFSIGSTVGACALAFCVHKFGAPFIDQWYSDIRQTPFWRESALWIEDYGLLTLVLVSLSPLPMAPPILLSALAGISTAAIGLAVLAARLLKYLTLGYLATHAPQLLDQLWLRKRKGLPKN